WYRDDNDSVAMHNDKVHQQVPCQPLALDSLGSAWRRNSRDKTGGRALGIDLEPGSLPVMIHASQLTHEHGIPKTARPVAPRMGVVFRARPQAARTRYSWQAGVGASGSVPGPGERAA